MAIIATRLTNTGTFYVNGTFDEITTSTNRITTNTVYASSLDEVTLTKGSSNPSLRQTNTGSIQVSTIFDEFTGAPVVDSSLLQWVDAAQTSSYPGTGSTWNDISGKNAGYTLSTATFTSASGGAIVVPTANQLTNNGTITINGAHTVSVWVNQTIVDGTIRRWLTIGNDIIAIRNDGIASTGQLNYYITLNGTIAGSGGIVRVNAQVTAGQTANFVGVWTGAILYCYKNGVLVGSSGATGTFSCSGQSYRISSDTEPFVGNFYQAQVYNRALSADEILQNFNSLRRRYGL